MARSVTRRGDADVPHCSGMSRQGASSDTFVNGIPVSLQGHNNTPHLRPAGRRCRGHSAGISRGSSQVFVNGRGIGRIGDGIGGCTAVARGSRDTFAG